MKHIQLFFIACLCLLISGVQAQNTAFGYGSSATGGGNATPTLVNSVSGLKSALTASGSGVIIITQNLTFTSMAKLKATNKTVLALPGVKLISAQQNEDNSGILYFTSGSKNLILRNLTFEGPGAYDCDGNDLLCFDGVTNAWVDHCDFSDGCDGNFDNKGNTDNVTVSWCRFHYNKPPKSGGSGGASDHRFTNLLGSDSGDKPADGTYNMTWAYCWWDSGCVERMLRCRNANLHFLNCYWNSSVAKYYIGPENVKAYIEGCWFVLSNKSKIFYENYGGTNACKFVNSYGSSGLPSDKGTVSAPTYSYTPLTYTEAKTQITNATCGAGATLVVTNSGAVSSACDTPAPDEPTLSVTGTPSQNVTEGSAISNIVFTAGGSAINIAVSGLPAGLNASKSGLVLTISGTPTASGTYTVTATDGSQTATKTGTITLKAPVAAPNGDMCLDLTKGEAPSVANGGIPSEWNNLVFTENNAKLTWSTTEGLKMGGNADYIVMDFSAYTGISINTISFDVTIPNWTADKNTVGYRYATSGTNTNVNIASSATETVVLTAPANTKVFAIQRTAGTSTNIKSICFTFNGSAAPEEAAPMLSNPSNASQTVTEGTAIEDIVFTASGTATSIAVSGLPAGLTSSKSGLVLTISGTPTASGTYTITATNASGNTTTKTGTVTVNPKPEEAAPTLSNPSNASQTVTEGTAISNIVFTASGTATSISVSGLPAGLTSSRSGLVLTISGTPTASGTYTVTATNASDNTATKTGTVTVNPKPDEGETTGGEGCNAYLYFVAPADAESNGVTNTTRFSGVLEDGGNLSCTFTFDGKDYTITRRTSNKSDHQVAFSVSNGAVGTLFVVHNQKDRQFALNNGSITAEVVAISGSTGAYSQTFANLPAGDYTMTCSANIGLVFLGLQECSTLSTMHNSLEQSAIRLVGNVLQNPLNERVQIFNITGQLLQTATTDVDMSRYQRGIYIVRTESATLKIIRN